MPFRQLVFVSKVDSELFFAVVGAVADETALWDRPGIREQRPLNFSRTCPRDFPSQLSERDQASDVQEKRHHVDHGFNVASVVVRIHLQIGTVASFLREFVQSVQIAAHCPLWIAFPDLSLKFPVEDFMLEDVERRAMPILAHVPALNSRNGFDGSRQAFFVALRLARGARYRRFAGRALESLHDCINAVRPLDQGDPVVTVRNAFDEQPAAVAQLGKLGRSHLGSPQLSAVVISFAAVRACPRIVAVDAYVTEIPSSRERNVWPDRRVRD